MSAALFRMTFGALARYLPTRSPIRFLYAPVSVVVVFLTVFHCPETRRWILTGTNAAQSVNPSPTLTFPRATRCLRRRSVTLLGCSLGSPQWSSGGGTWKAVALRTAPSPTTSLNVLTRIGPSAASEGTTTLICVGVSGAPVCVAVAAYGAKRTSPPTAAVMVVPEFLRRFLPAITTVVPADPAHGVNDVTVGEQAPGLVLVKSVGLFAVPLTLVTWIVPLVVPATVAQIVVAETILNAVTGVPPISTLDTAGLSKSVPVITTTQPAGPLVGENDVMVGRPRVPRPPGRARLRSPRPRPPLCVDRGVARTGSWLRPRSANEIYPAPLALPAPDVIRSSAMVITTV